MDLSGDAPTLAANASSFCRDKFESVSWGCVSPLSQGTNGSMSASLGSSLPKPSGPSGLRGPRGVCLLGFGCSLSSSFLFPRSPSNRLPNVLKKSMKGFKRVPAVRPNVSRSESARPDRQSTPASLSTAMAVSLCALSCGRRTSGSLTRSSDRNSNACRCSWPASPPRAMSRNSAPNSASISSGSGMKPTSASSNSHGSNPHSKSGKSCTYLHAQDFILLLRISLTAIFTFSLYFGRYEQIQYSLYVL